MRTMLLAPGGREPQTLLAPVVRGYALNAEALAGIALVRRFRFADICDRETVIRLIGALGYDRGANWLMANPHLYFLALEEVQRTHPRAAGHTP